MFRRVGKLAMEYKKIVHHNSFEEMEDYVEWTRSEEGKKVAELIKRLKPVLDRLQ